jgi:hypothetical protein
MLHQPVHKSPSLTVDESSLDFLTLADRTGNHPGSGYRLTWRHGDRLPHLPHWLGGRDGRVGSARRGRLGWSRRPDDRLDRSPKPTNCQFQFV